MTSAFGYTEFKTLKLIKITYVGSYSASFAGPISERVVKPVALNKLGERKVRRKKG